MNHTASITLPPCGFALVPSFDPANVSSSVAAVFIFRTTVNAITCPFIILLNALVIMAVKTKRQLRTKSNIILACLASTDLMVGLVTQPLQIASYSFMIKGETDNSQFCTLNEVSMAVSITCLSASLFHLFLMSAERYIAIKHPFAYEKQVTEVRLMMASGVAWVAVIVVPFDLIRNTNETNALQLEIFIILYILVPATVYFNVVIYKEVRRNEKQIISNQVSLEAKEKMLKNKKSFYTTLVMILTIFLCFIPTNICLTIFNSFTADRIPNGVRGVVLSLVTLLPFLNSLFNPLIYVVRIRYFRVALIQLLLRKNAAQAEELESRTFESRQNRVIVIGEQRKMRAGQEEDDQQENKTLSNKHTAIVETQPQAESQNRELAL